METVSLVKFYRKKIKKLKKLLTITTCFDIIKLHYKVVENQVRFSLQV